MGKPGVTKQRMGDTEALRDIDFEVSCLDYVFWLLDNVPTGSDRAKISRDKYESHGHPRLYFVSDPFTVVPEPQ